MECASHFAYKKAKKCPQKSQTTAQVALNAGEEEEEIDTNVISVKFKTLKQAEENMQMGDPFFCKKCKSCLSSASKLINKSDYQSNLPIIKEEKLEEEKKEEEVPESKKKIADMASVNANPSSAKHEKIWICEFCGTDNLVDIDTEEVPKSDDVIYLLQSAEQMGKTSSDFTSDVTTIFCIDNSGSMGVTNEIQGKHDLRHGLSEEEYEMLKKFIEYGADQYLPNQTKGTTFVSRKQCVLAAIEEQLLASVTQCPNKKVGLVTFNDEVNVIGDGKNLPEVIAGDKLYKYDELLKIGQELGNKLVSATVKESAQDLVKKFEKLQESGKTALGPALLVSLGLSMCGKQGSRIILCTDGLANIGLGEMTTEKESMEAEAFYSQIGILAKEKGISISVISIKGEGCKLNILSGLVDLTAGSLTKVDPNEITKKFASIMKNEVIGTQAEVKLRLHQGMKFRNEQADVLQDKESLYQNQVGNVTARTQLTFEYEFRSEEELKEIGLDLNHIENVPFQAQIVYTSSNGDKLMRVITKMLKVTENLNEAEKNVNMKVLATRALHEQGKYASKKMHEKSEKVASGWGKYLNGNAAKYGAREDMATLDKFNNNKEGLRKANARKADRKLLTERMRYDERDDEDEEMVYKVKNFHFECEEE